MASTQTRWQIAGDYKKPSAKAPVIDPGDEAPFLVRGGEEERAGQSHLNLEEVIE